MNQEVKPLSVAGLENELTGEDLELAVDDIMQFIIGR